MNLKYELVGGMRRVKDNEASTHHDIDILITLDDSESSIGRLPFKPAACQATILSALHRGGHIIHELTSGISVLNGESRNKTDEKKHITSLLIMKNEDCHGRRVDLVVVPPEHWSFSLLGWSGSTEMEKSWKHYTKHYYTGRPNEVDKYGRIRKNDRARCRWYLSNSRLCYAVKREGHSVLDSDVCYEEVEGTYKTERDILRGLGLPYLHPWQRCA